MSSSVFAGWIAAGVAATLDSTANVLADHAEWTDHRVGIGAPATHDTTASLEHHRAIWSDALALFDAWTTGIERNGHE